MSEYKIVYKASHFEGGASHEIEWERGCPLVFDAFQVSRNTETGEAYLQAKVKNICPEVIESFEALFTCVYIDGSKETLKANPLDADIVTGGDYTLQPIELRQGNIDAVSASIHSAVTPSGGWSTSSSPTEYPTRKALGLCDEAATERALQLAERGCSLSATAAMFPVEEHDCWTLCACGQLNVGTEACVTCGLSPLKADPAIEDEASLLVLARERAEEAERKKEELRRKKAEAEARVRKLLPYIGLATLAIVVILLVNFVAIPAMERGEANHLIESGDYPAAIAAFEKLGDEEGIEKAKAAQAESIYLSGVELMESEQYEKALSVFSELGEYKDGLDRKKECQDALDYISADADMKSGKIAEAAIKFGSLGEYRDAPKRSDAAWAEVAVRDKISASDSAVVAVKQDGTAVVLDKYPTSNYEWSESLPNLKDLSAVAAGGALVGLANDGSVRYATVPRSDFDAAPSWENIVSVSASKSAVIGLKSDGTVAVDCYLHDDGDFRTWDNVVAVTTCGEAGVLGLKSDGTVLVRGALDLDYEEESAIEGWTNISAIDGGDVFVVGVTTSGTVVYEGIWFNKDILQWKDIVSISAGNDVVIGLKSDGTAVVSHSRTYEEDKPISVEGWSNLVSVSAGDGFVVGLTADGTVLYSGEDDDWELKDVASWSGIATN